MLRLRSAHPATMCGVRLQSPTARTDQTLPQQCSQLTLLAPLLASGTGRGRGLGSSSRGQGIVAFDGLTQLGALLGRREVSRLFELAREIGQFAILDRLIEPTRVVAPAQMVAPRLVVHAIGHLEKRQQVLRAEVEAIIGAAEVETLVGAKLALHIFTLVAVALGARHGGAQ